MLSNHLISLIHIIIFYGLAFSIFINQCDYKRFCFFILCFLFLQYISKYGKCGIINIERFFLKENFKSGFFYRLIKPVICYKINPMGTKYFWILILYIGILLWQLKKMNCSLNILHLYRDLYIELKNKFITN